MIYKLFLKNCSKSFTLTYTTIHTHILPLYKIEKKNFSYIIYLKNHIYY